MTATLVAAASASRVSLTFNYAWRFHYGDDPSSPPDSGPGTCTFEEDLQDLPICAGMEHNPNRFSEKDCRLACCYDPECLVWQAFPLENGRACYHGYSSNVSCAPGSEPSGMGGGRRAHKPSPAFRTDYTFATADAACDVDADWEVVDAPHDFISAKANFANDVTNFKQGYLPRNASWYRKHFTLPASFEHDGLASFLHFEGVFHHTTIFLNGHYLFSHECGYTGFSVRLDNASSLRYGQPNVLAVRADASFGSGHWYEGGGLYRPIQLLRLHPLHIVTDGLFASPQSDGTTVHVTAEVEHTPLAIARDVQQPVSVKVSLLNGSHVLVTNISATAAVGSSSHTFAVELHPPTGLLKRWSIQSPELYTVRAEVITSGAAVDALEVQTGFRPLEWTGAGVMLNGERVALRGFSHHVCPARTHSPVCPAALPLKDQRSTLSREHRTPLEVSASPSLSASICSECRLRGPSAATCGASRTTHTPHISTLSSMPLAC